MFSNTSNELFATNLAEYILSRIIGNHPEDEISNVRPSRKYLIGTLAANKFSDSLNRVPTNDDNVTSMRATRMEVGVLVEDEELQAHPSVTLNASGNVYYPIDKKDSIKSKCADDVDDTDDTEYTEDKSSSWKRVHFSNQFIVDISKEGSYKIDFSNIVKVTNGDPSIKKNIPLGLWAAEVQITLKKYDDTHTLISFYYENKAVESEEDKIFEKTLFNCNLEVDLKGLKTKEFNNEYMYNGYPQRFFYDFLTMNCQAEWINNVKTVFHIVYAGKLLQDNVQPRTEIRGLDLSFINLMNSVTAIASLEGLLEKMEIYEKLYEKNYFEASNPDSYQPRIGKRQQTWKEREDLINHFKKLFYRVREGVELIKNDPLVRECFLQTNETFCNNYLNLPVPIQGAGWRLFQLIFLLSTIKSVVKEEHLDEADVLHVDTGGGKSEAYFALITFTAFYERASGKENGVSAIVKFPLRMLSIQQLERISSVIIHAENVRNKYPDKYPGEPFSLGYYVGSKDEDFPKLYGINKQHLYDGSKLLSPSPESPIISKCPLCPSSSKGTIRLEDDTDHRRLLHKCDKCQQIFYIYLSDREIYRWQPTVIVSTVDKWAGLASQRRLRSLLGGNGSMCSQGHGFIPSGDKCEDNRDEDFKCDEIGNKLSGPKGPRLSIQDEMHLLREGFGTIAAHFEGLIEEFVKETSGRPLKHIAMSATLNGTENQIHELYNKNKFFVIPGRCPEGTGSENDFFFEKVEGPKRIIYGMKPNLRDNHYASLVTLLHYGEFMINAQKELNSNTANFCQKYGLNNSVNAQKLITRYIAPLTYHIKKQDAYEMGRLDETVVGNILTATYKVDLKGNALTGDDSLETLKSTINSVHRAVNDYDPYGVDTGSMIYKPIYATSVVSHGVDLEEWNFMVFQGLPYSTSEYIQALSRVGRKNLGIVMLWFYPNRVRDDSFYRNFRRYHESLDHEVRPVPINRYARLGMLQTVNSLFCAGIINFLSNKKNEPLYLKKHILNLSQDDKKVLIDFITRIYGKQSLDIKVSDEVEKRITYLVLRKGGDTDSLSNALNDSGDTYYRNQTGMRGIQKNLALIMSSKDEKLLKDMGVLR